MPPHRHKGAAPFGARCKTPARPARGGGGGREGAGREGKTEEAGPRVRSGLLGVSGMLSR